MTNPNLSSSEWYEEKLGEKNSKNDPMSLLQGREGWGSFCYFSHLVFVHSFLHCLNLDLSWNSRVIWYAIHPCRLNRSQDMALELPAPCSDFFGGKWEEPGDAIQVTWGIRGFPVNPNISKVDLLLGLSGDNRLANLIFLVAKQYIYSCILVNFQTLHST